MQFGVFSHNLSIDEEMVPYFGRHSAKMFIRNKPVRFGFKLWCLCSSQGYLYQFIPYGGANQQKENSGLGLGSDIVLKLLSLVESANEHRVFFDNFFSSYNLFCELNNKGYAAVGTIRDNRTAKCPLEENKQLQKKERGSFDYAYDTKQNICVVKWHDNSVVSTISNTEGVFPTSSVKRYSRKEKKELLVTQPQMIAVYNKNMGGVDLHDNGIANYRIKIRGKKWWWPLFINMIDSCIVNAWRIYEIANEKTIPQIQFRSNLVLSLTKFEQPSHSRVNPNELIEDEVTARIITFPNRGRPSRNSLPDDVRYSNIGHIIIQEENKARRKCRLCKSHTIFKCDKCNVHIHPRCFDDFHTK